MGWWKSTQHFEEEGCGTSEASTTLGTDPRLPKSSCLRVLSVRYPCLLPLSHPGIRMEPFHRHVSDGFRMYWQALVDSVKQMVQKLVGYAAEAEGEGGGRRARHRSEDIKGVPHNSLWHSVVDPSVVLPATAPAVMSPSRSARACAADSRSERLSCALVYRKLLNGSGTDFERAALLHDEIVHGDDLAAVDALALVLLLERGEVADHVHRDLLRLLS